MTGPLDPQKTACHQPTMEHRNPLYMPHIDGLRTIAVMGVLLFHFGATWLPGGFVGVDVFFVISGFLISRSIHRDLEEGRFSLIEFYERRARRILPALLATTTAVAVASYFLLFPVQLVEFSKSVLAAVTFTSNIYFFETSDYFAPQSTQIPLLHYWSLGVEEQFYIIFPFLAFLMFKMPMKLGTILLIVLVVFSMALSQAMLVISPQASFYLLPFRAFELAIGCVIARKDILLPSSKLVAGIAVWGGVLMIVGAMLLITEHMAFPGALALVPCLGAVLVIWGASQNSTRLSRILGRGVFASVGAISYSLYLVHWPVVVFLFPLTKEYFDGLGMIVLGIVVSILLAWLSYRFIEQPFRLRRRFWTRRKIFIGSALGVALLSVCSTIAIREKGFPNRLEDRVAAILEWRKYNPTTAFRGGKCFLEPNTALSDYDETTCLPRLGKGSVILWGDSSIAQYYTGLSELMNTKEIQVGQLTSSLCAPILNNMVASRPLCKNFNDLAIDRIIRLKPDLVIIGAVWDTRVEIMDKLSQTLRLLNAEGLRVVVLGQPPYYLAPVPEILAKRIGSGNPSTTSDKDMDFDTLLESDKIIQSVVAKYPHTQFVSVLAMMCPQKQCPMTSGAAPLHFDQMHLTPVGSRLYASKVIQAYKGLFNSRAD